MDMNVQIPAGYSLLANYNNLVVMAQADEKELPGPYVTWEVNNDSGVLKAFYFQKLEDAQWNFCERAFCISKTASNTLKRQLDLLSKRSETCSNDELPRLSVAMAKLLEIVFSY